MNNCQEFFKLQIKRNAQGSLTVSHDNKERETVLLSLPTMWIPTIYFFIILYPLSTENRLHWLRKTRHKWKSRNLQKLTRTLQLRDAENSKHYLPRTSRNFVTFNSSNSPSFEDVVLQLKEIGILDLPNVSVIRGLNSSQSKNAKRSVSSSSKASKRCGGTQHGGVNPCGGGCLRSISDYSIAGVATLRARDFDCSARSPCFDGRGWCQKLTRNFDLIAQDGDRAVSKTLEVPVACICASFAAK